LADIPLNGFFREDRLVWDPLTVSPRRHMRRRREETNRHLFRCRLDGADPVSDQVRHRLPHLSGHPPRGVGVYVSSNLRGHMTTSEIARPRQSLWKVPWPTSKTSTGPTEAMSPTRAV